MNSSLESAIAPPGPRQLAIETIQRGASISLLDGTEVIAERTLPPGPSAAAALTPAVQALLRTCRKQGPPLDFVSVADGPGSFTGLRIGVTTAKALAYGLGLPVVGVDSLAAIAATVMYHHGECHGLLVGLNAYRGQTYAGSFQRAALLPSIEQIPADWTPHPATVDVVDASGWRRYWERHAVDAGFAGKVGFVGDAVELEPQLPRWTARGTAIGVGLLAYRAAIAGQLSDPLQLLPRYLKLSAAEEQHPSPPD